MEEGNMPVTFHLPPYLAGLIGGRDSIVMEGLQPRVGEALRSLSALHPALHDRIFDEQGEVRAHINIFVGNECIRFTGGLLTRVKDGADVFILPAPG
jgi:sulfur-carrier protein